jgi:hypothetical protein
MKNLLIAVAALLAALCAVSACRQHLPTNRFLQPRTAGRGTQSTADARHKFDHDAHAKILAQRSVTCVDCHRFDAEISTTNESVVGALSGAAQYPGSAACHFCHGPSETRLSAAPSACTTCHDNIAPLLPADHQIAWVRVHASVASADPVACQNCHRDQFCIDCHQNRDSILTFVHERNYLSYHSIDARANPMQCGSCHREDFCTNCHAQTAH